VLTLPDAVINAAAIYTPWIRLKGDVENGAG